MQTLRNLFRLPAAMALLSVLLACGGGGAGGIGGGSTNGGIDPNYRAVTGITISPSTTLLNYNLRQEFSAVASGPEAFADTLRWTASAGSLSATTGGTTVWTAPASGATTGHWVRATSTLTSSVSATATITLTGKVETADQGNLEYVTDFFKQNARASLFAVGTASPVWQTFQPACRTLTGISLYFVVVNSPYGDDVATVKIRTLAGDVLGTATIPLSLASFKSGYGWYENRAIYAPITGTGIPVVPGQTYVIALEGTRHTFGWGILDGNKYTPGMGFLNNLPLDGGDGDYLFQTFGN
jgi:hypothetical protein